MSLTYQQLTWDPSDWDGTTDPIEGEFVYNDDTGTLRAEGFTAPGFSGQAWHGSAIAAGRDTVFVSAASIIGPALAMWQDTPPIQLPFGDDPFQIPKPLIASPPPPPPESLPQGNPRVRIRWNVAPFQNKGLVPSQGITLNVLIMSQSRRRGGFIPTVIGENYYDSGEIVLDIPKVLFLEGQPTAYRIMVLPQPPQVLQGSPNDYSVKLQRPFTFQKTLTGDPTGVELGTYNVNWTLTQQP